MCGLVDSEEDEFDWSRGRDSTPTGNTGPDRASQGEYYIYVETSNPRVQGDKARWVRTRCSYSQTYKDHTLQVLRGILSMLQ